MLTHYQLPFKFDTELLKADLQLILPGEWKAHFNANYYVGDWSGVALRSTDGNPAQLYPDPSSPQKYINTPILVRCLYFQSVLAEFKCPLESVRLLRLSPGSAILEHSDHDLSLESEILRIHLPISTDPRVEFVVDNQRLLMREGEAWYINLGFPHSAHNHSGKDRIHLVIDCVSNDWLRALIPFDSSIPQPPKIIYQPSAAEVSEKSQEQLNEFRQLVLQEISLQKKLRETPNLKSFLSLILQLGEERGYSFTAEDVEIALRDSRRAWNKMWV